jgi:meiotically up-regulated gene 157 (Mug157) protein
MSEALREKLKNITENINGTRNDEKLKRMFVNCFMSTIDTTVKNIEDMTTYVITGDIDAMWLRDSSGQVRHYIDFAKEDKQLRSTILGVIRRQIKYINIDPYANAFNMAPNGRGAVEDITEMGPWIWERKYEIDSLCYPVQLSYLFWKITGETKQFDSLYKETIKKIIAHWKLEQKHENSPYTFQRLNCPETDTLTNNGRGAEVAYTGMTWSGFRPSDDRCVYGYLVPSNMFAVVVLKYIEEIAQAIYGDAELLEEARELREQIDKGIKEYAVVTHPEFGRVYAYEVDGLGNYLLMDDANVPSLLSMPYIGYCSKEDETYSNTRRMLLSKTNPYYYEGKFAQGIGSPHTPSGYIWPMSLIMQALTSDNREEILELINTLLQSDDNRELMHESFDPNDPSIFTRAWFAWANSLFAELIIHFYGGI